jgi:TetR/AcrR family transcriptional regulator, cholesterol catabolism regulator
MEQPALKNRVDKQKIIEASLPIMTSKGFRGTSMRDVAKSLGIKAGSLYYHIRCKDEILEIIHDNLIDALLKKSEEILNEKISPKRKLELFATTLTETLVDLQDYAVVFFSDYKYLSKQYLKRITKKRIQYQDLLQKILEEGVTKGEFKKFDIKVISRGFMGMFVWTHTWVNRDGKFSPVDIAKIYSDMILTGISK